MISRYSLENNIVVEYLISEEEAILVDKKAEWLSSTSKKVLDYIAAKNS